MKINRVVVGQLEENCYILVIDDKCLIVDPGDEANKIIDEIGSLKVLGILITHHHFDHIGALNELKEKYKVDVYDFNSCEEKEYEIGQFKFSVIYNPGHTKDSISFYFKKDKVMFVGDFVFHLSVGRVDLEGGNFEEMEESIDKLKKINENITLFPGHGSKTTLNFEKENNPYF